MGNPFASAFGSKPVSRRRKWLAVIIAAFIDAFRLITGGAFGFFDPNDDFLDFVAVGALLMIVGFRWELGLAFVAELIPGIAVFPTWTALALSLPVSSAAALEAAPETRTIQPTTRDTRPVFVAEQ